MELGLSLGDSSKPIMGLMEKSCSKKRLGFCMGLSIGDDEEGKRSEEKRRVEDPDPATTQLVPRNSSSLLALIPWSSDNGGSSEAGSSGQMGARGGFDVNKYPEEEEEEEEGSPNNSGASSFQMEMCIYSGGQKNGERRVSDEDENACTRKKLRLSKQQSAFLEQSFKQHNTLNPKQKIALAKQLNLRPRQVEVWFQNRRARTKLKQTEVDCEYLKRCCETLTEENRRLHKELQDLRALKSSNPFYMQLPATTLTMCPSCERVATSTTTPPTTTTASLYPFSHNPTDN